MGMLIASPDSGISVLYIRHSFDTLFLTQLKQQALLGGSCRRVRNHYSKRILNLILNRKKFFLLENETLGKQKNAAFLVPYFTIQRSFLFSSGKVKMKSFVCARLFVYPR